MISFELLCTNLSISLDVDLNKYRKMSQDIFVSDKSDSGVEGTNMHCLIYQTWAQKGLIAVQYRALDIARPKERE